VEHAHPIGRDLSWRKAALPLALLGGIALAALGGRALPHRVGTSAAAQEKHATAPPAAHPGHLRPRSATSVLVLNGNGIAGAAGGISRRLRTDGYRSAFATNAQVTTYARSVVLYRPGWADEAARLAKDVGIRTVAPLDGSLPATGSHYPLVAIVGHE
jgi:hypothetical protein